MNSKQQRAAQDFAALGILLFPQDRNKKPCIKDWPKLATTDLVRLLRWSNDFPKANFAALCGEASNILVVDIDTKNGQQGLKSWTDFAAERAVKTFTVRTPSGGKHLYFRWDSSLDFTKIQELLPGVEAIGNRQCVTIPGGLYAAGGEYVIEKNVPIARAPEWLVEKIIQFKPKPTPAPQPEETEKGAGKPEKIPDGQRTRFLTSQAGKYRSQGLGREAIYNKLIQDFRDHCETKTPLKGGTPQKIAGIAESYAKYPAGLSDTWTDLANARRFVALCTDRLIYCAPHARWYFWDGQRFAEDRTNRVLSLSKELIRGLYVEASEIQEDRARKAFVKGALSLEQKNKILSMTDLARDELAVVPEDLDANPALFNIANGVLDLPENKVIPHSPSMKITKLSDVKFEKGAECPLWLKHLATCFSDDLDLIRYFQKLVGYTLCGENSEQIFVFVYGPGETGKSTTVNIIEKLLGDYAVRTAIETFLQQRQSEHPASLYAMIGARLIIAQEPGKGRKWNEARINELSGERKISARRMRADPEQVSITGKIWISSNNKPRVDDTDAFWRRIKLLPFDYKIPPALRVLDYDKVMWEAEASGILNWSLRGYRAWQEEGLQPTPARVQNSINSYRDDADVLKEFIDGKIEKIQGAKIGAQKLYDAYRQWTNENGLKAFSNKKFPTELEERGCTRKRTENGMIWLNLTLKP